MRLFTLTLIASLVAIGCSKTEMTNGAVAHAAPENPISAGSAVPSSTAVRACGHCQSYAQPVTAGTVPSVLDELSGLAASHSHPGVIYMHNDSGDSARFFAMSEAATALGEFHVQGASASDWEDIAVGPCPAGSCVFLGDIGDNRSVRSEYTVYRVTEPNVSADKPAGTIDVPSEALPFVYPDGSHNAETLLADPAGGDLYVVTKIENGQGKVYRFPKPFTPGKRTTLDLVTTINLPQSAGVITGGDFHPCEHRLLVRTYMALYEFVSPQAGPLADVFAATPVVVPAPLERQGEAVAYRSDGNGYFVASEGHDIPLYAVKCP